MRKSERVSIAQLITDMREKKTNKKCIFFFQLIQLGKKEEEKKYRARKQ